MCRAMWEGRIEEARDVHYRIMDLVDALFVEPNPTPVKQAVGVARPSGGSASARPWNA